MERRKFSKEFKLEAIELSYNSDRTVAQVAGNLGIRAEVLYRWRGKCDAQKVRRFPATGS